LEIKLFPIPHHMDSTPIMDNILGADRRENNWFKVIPEHINLKK